MACGNAVFGFGSRNDPSFWCIVINDISMVHPLGEWFASFDFVYLGSCSLNLAKIEISEIF